MKKKFCKNSRNYIIALKRRGFKQIGAGAYSTVLAKPGSGRCVKILRSGTVDNWPEYMLWSRARTTVGKKHAPKLYSLKRYKNFYVAVVERIPQIGLGEIPEKHVDRVWKILSPSRHTSKVKGKRPKKYDSLFKFMKRLRKDFWVDDMHSGNVGRRANGTIVVLDPVTNSWSSDWRTDNKKGVIKYMGVKRYRAA